MRHYALRWMYQVARIDCPKHKKHKVIVREG